jgi:hypothetical protein
MGLRQAFAIIALPAATALALFAAGGTAGADEQLLIATVGTNDGFDIGLAFPDGRPVSELKPGTYTVRVRDWQVMNGSFLVISATAPPPPPKPVVKTLRASVGPTGKSTLSATSVRAGRFRIVVRDRSARHNFRLAGRGMNRTTGADFTGSVTWRVRLAKGVYRFGSDVKKLPGRLRVR